MPLAVFEPAIPAGERPQAHALDRSATGIGVFYTYVIKTYILCICVCTYVGLYKFTVSFRLSVRRPLHVGN